MIPDFKYTSPKATSDVVNIIRLLEPELGPEFRNSLQSWVTNKERPYALDVWEIFIAHDAEIDCDIGVFGYYHHKGDKVGRYWIGWLGVVKEFRRKGLATLMIKAIESELSNLEAKEIWTYTDSYNQAALSLFHKNGMNVWGPFKDTKLPQQGATENSIALMKKINT